MPLNKYKSEKEAVTVDHFVNALATGLVKHESNGKYDAQNPQSSAAGKYQFVKAWLENPDNKKMSIKYFAEKAGYEVPKDMNEFKSNPALQDAWFKYYAENALYPKAKDLLVGPNPKGLSLESIGAVMHFQGEGAAKSQINTGEFKKATKKGVDGATVDNMGVLEYVNHFENNLKESGYKPINPSDVLDLTDKGSKKKEQIISDYEKRQNEIDSNEYITQAEKEKRRKALWQDVYNKGNVDIVNNHINDLNDKNKGIHNANVKDFEKLRDYIQDLDITYTEDPETGKKKLGKTAFFQLTNEEDKFIHKEMVAKFGLYQKGPAGAAKKRVDIDKLKKAFANSYKEVTGKDIQLSLSNDKNVGLENSDWFSQVFLNTPNENQTGVLSLKNLDNPTSFKGLTTIDPSQLEPRQIVEPEPEETPAEDDKEEESTEEETTSRKTSPVEESDLVNDFFNNQLKLDSLGNGKTRYVPSKRELPIDAVTGMLMLAKGQKEANTELPLRTEEVSTALMAYTEELKKMSKDGLPPEVEAAMKSKLAESYQAGLENIVNASAGNRATVLGNLGSLESAKNKGIVAMQVKDYEAKERAFQQYGKAIEYINDFNTRREVANHGIKFDEARRKQIQGQATAAAGMKNIIDSVKHARDTGPGSAMDMYKSKLAIDMFGFNPNAKDDGSGTQYGTKSWFEKNAADAKAKSAHYQEVHEKYNALNPNQKKAAHDVYTKTMDVDKLDAFISDVKDKPNYGIQNMSREELAKNNMELSPLDSLAKAETVKMGMDKPVVSEIPNLATPPINEQQGELAALNSLGQLNQEDNITDNVITQAEDTLASFENYYNNQ